MSIRFRRMRKLGRKISKVDKAVHRDGEEKEEEDTCCPSDMSFGGLATIRDFLLQIACSVFCLCILYSIALIFAESAGLIIEVSSFTEVRLFRLTFLHLLFHHVGAPMPLAVNLFTAIMTSDDILRKSGSCMSVGHRMTYCFNSRFSYTPNWSKVFEKNTSGQQTFCESLFLNEIFMNGTDALAGKGLRNR